MTCSLMGELVVRVEGTAMLPLGISHQMGGVPVGPVVTQR